MRISCTQYGFEDFLVISYSSYSSTSVITVCGLGQHSMQEYAVHHKAATLVFQAHAAVPQLVHNEAGILCECAKVCLIVVASEHAARPQKLPLG